MSVPGLQLVTPLKDLCISAVASNFEANPCLEQLEDSPISKKIIDKLPLDLPLELAGTLIKVEDYWQRRACSTWKNCEVAAHGNSWKQLYFERHLQDVLESWDPISSDLMQLRRLMAFSRRFVQTLHIRQLPSHLDLQLLFECMVNTPSALSVGYHTKSVGMTYDRTLFGMKLADCRCLAQALTRCETLTQLCLAGNGLDDDKVRMLASGLTDNISITHLDLSHNKISDKGVQALVKVMTDPNSIITTLNLANNQVHADGGRNLARAIKQSQSLTSLNLRLNGLGEEGCTALATALRSSTQLEALSLAANAGGSVAGEAMAYALEANSSLRELDLSCNTFGPEAGAKLRAAVEMNSTLRAIDVRRCGLQLQDEEAVVEVMRNRQDKQERAKVLGQQGY